MIWYNLTNWQKMVHHFEILLLLTPKMWVIFVHYRLQKVRKLLVYPCTLAYFQSVSFHGLKSYLLAWTFHHMKKSSWVWCGYSRQLTILVCLAGSDNARIRIHVTWGAALGSGMNWDCKAILDFDFGTRWLTVLAWPIHYICHKIAYTWHGWTHWCQREGEPRKEHTRRQPVETLFTPIHAGINKKTKKQIASHKTMFSGQLVYDYQES